MSIFETIGLFYIVFATGIATALFGICLYLGATLLWKTYRRGSELPEMERIFRS